MKAIRLAPIGVLFLAACSLSRAPCRARQIPSYLPTPIGATSTPAPGQSAVLGCHAGRVWGVAFSRDGRYMASTGNQDGTVGLWDVEAGREIATLKGPEGLLLNVAFSPDGSLLAVASRKEAVRVWRLPSRTVAADLSFSDTPWGIAFSPDNRTLLTSTGYQLEAHDVLSSEVLFKIDAEGGYFGDVAYTPDGAALAVTDPFNHTLLILDAADGRLRSTLGATQASNGPIAIHPTEPLLATGDDDGRVYLYRLDTGELVRQWQAHGDGINDVEFSPDGRYLATASGQLFNEILQPKDISVRLWDVASGSQIAVFEDPSGPVPSLAFSPDGATLAGASFDGTVRLWALPED